jgi:hypothetical protein
MNEAAAWGPVSLVFRAGRHPYRDCGSHGYEQQRVAGTMGLVADLPIGGGTAPRRENGRLVRKDWLEGK